MKVPSFEQVKELSTKASDDEVAGIAADINQLLSRNPVLVVDIVPLISFILGRVNTLVILSKMGHLWDAEIILRTVLETFIKFLRIVSQEDLTALEKKLDEFWITLDEIDRVSHSDKAKEIISSGRITTPETIRPLILLAEEEAIIKAKPSWGNRNYRTKLKNDWSFSAILMELLNMDKMTPLISFEMIQYYYKLASHVAHGDKQGIHFVQGLEKKDGNYKEASQLTLYIKQLKVATQVPFWISLELTKLLNDRDKGNEILARYRTYTQRIVALHKPIMQELDRLTSEFIRNNNVRPNYYGPLRPRE
jgi:hypothetical protein